MKITVSKVPDEGMDVQFGFTCEVAGGRLERASAGFRVEKVDEEVMVRGEVSAVLALECGRCLKGFEEELKVPVDLVFFKADAEGSEGDGEERAELFSEDMDTGQYEDDELDLGHLAEEQIIINTPMKPLCSEGCKGLCPTCGADLNTAPCGCQKASLDPRLQALGKLMTKEKTKNGKPNS